MTFVAIFDAVHPKGWKLWNESIHDVIPLLPVRSDKMTYVYISTKASVFNMIDVIVGFNVPIFIYIYIDR
jgi:hypothetical protein